MRSIWAGRTLAWARDREGREGEIDPPVLATIELYADMMPMVARISIET